MDLNAILEFLWAIVVVVLRVFRIVPKEVETAPSTSLVMDTGRNASTIAPTMPKVPSLTPNVAPSIHSTAEPSLQPKVLASTGMPVLPTTNAPITLIPTLAPVITAITGSPVIMAGPFSPSGIESFVLVYAPTNAELMELQDGDVIDMQTLDGVSSLAFNVKVNPSNGIGAVLFAENGRQENTLPFSFCGDNAGAYNACAEITTGKNTITVTPLAAGTSSPLPQIAISFEIIGVSSVEGADQGPIDEIALETNLSVGRWIEIDTNADIDARHEACFVMVTNASVGRRAILIGGRGTKRTDVFDPVSRTWTSGPAPPAQLHHMQCVEAQGKVWIMAAWTDWYPKEKNAEYVYVYDPATIEWTTRTAMPENRRRGAAAVIVSPDHRTIWVSHGNNGGHETGDHAESLPFLDAYDIETDTWTALSDEAPNPRDHTGGALVNGRICVGGGRNGGELYWPDVPVTDCYDLATGTWSEEAPIPDPRAGSSYGVSCDGRLLVAGGEGSGKAWNEVHAFDGTQWSTLASLNVGRHGSGLAVDCVCDQIIIASGAAGQGGGPEITSVEIFFPDGQERPCIA